MDDLLPPSLRRLTGPLAVLLVGASLRLVGLTRIPPGLTHDEADHGLDAWGVVNGVRPLYFTVGYGREPLFDYSTAGLMSFLGPNYLAGRLTAVFYSLLLLAGLYAWLRAAFGRRIAWLTTASLAVSFWGLMSGRQALRSITLPALFVLAVALAWAGWRAQRRDAPSGRRFLLAGLLLGASFYSYIPARWLWLIFPLWLGYLALIDRAAARRLWRPVAGMLLVAGSLALPLALYLRANPAAETRIGQLRGPLDAALAGNWQPLFTNAVGALQLFTLRGDPTWRYNIAGRPWLTPVMGLLFYAGLWVAIVALFDRRQSTPRRAASALALLWLSAGLAPALITGPALAMTQAIGLLPVLYLFPALAVAQGVGWLADRLRHGQQLWWGAALLLVAGQLYINTNDYFIVWAQNPEVGVQYETALLTGLTYLDDHPGGDVAISTTTPDIYHSPAAAALYADTPAALHWFNGQHSLLLPADPAARLLFTGFAPWTLTDYLRPGAATTLPQPADAIDQPLQLYAIDGPAARAYLTTLFTPPPRAVTVGETAVFLGAINPATTSAGATRHVDTLWQVAGPTQTEWVQFTQLLNGDGVLVAQDDRLDVPSRLWRPDDVFVQRHTLALPADLSPGLYTLTTGFYERDSKLRLAVTGADSAPGESDDFIPLAVIEVTP